MSTGGRSETHQLKGAIEQLATKNEKLSRKLASTIEQLGKSTRMVERNLNQQARVVGECQSLGNDLARRAQEQAEYLRQNRLLLDVSVVSAIMDEKSEKS